MASENFVEDGVKRHLPPAWTIGAWALVIIICLVSLVLSGMAWQRSKLDNNALRSITQITERLEKTASKLQALSEASNVFNRQQSDYLYNNDRDSKGGYDALSQKYETGNVTNDDGSNQWLFSQDDGKRSQ